MFSKNATANKYPSQYQKHLMALAGHNFPTDQDEKPLRLLVETGSEGKS